MALITVLGLVAGNAVIATREYLLWIKSLSLKYLPFSSWRNLYIGIYRSDLIESTKWRMYSLPYSPHEHAFSIIISTSIFNMIQGLVMVVFTHFVYDVNWEILES